MLDRVEDHREPSHGARGLDSVVGRSVREVKDLRTVREERRAAFAEVQPPRIQLAKQRDQPHGRAALIGGGFLYLG